MTPEQQAAVAPGPTGGLPTPVWDLLFEFHRSLSTGHAALCQAHRLALMAAHAAGWAAVGPPSRGEIECAAGEVGEVAGALYQLLLSLEGRVPMTRGGLGRQDARP